MSVISILRKPALLYLLLSLVFGLVVASGCNRSRASSNPTPTPSSLASGGNNPGTQQLPNVADIVKAVEPAVVSVTTQELGVGFFTQPVQQQGAGSGVIFDSKGYVLTNNHVVENASKMRITLPDGRTFDDIKVIGTDRVTDLAVIKINNAKDLPSAPLGNSDGLRAGDWVIAIGNALGLSGGPTVTVGVVGALGRSISAGGNGVGSNTLHDLIQTDAAINPGNSGGPLVSLQGEVVGINTAIDTRGQGIGFAISISSARPIVEQLVKNGKVIWPWIGIGAVTVTPGVVSELQLKLSEGVLVSDVPQGQPASKAGINSGDIIVQMNNQKITTVRQLQDLIRQHKIGDKVEITVNRNGNEQTLTMTLAEMPRS
ncbi:MAG: PDZ domain-containing protein [Dehalococcoidia bacterium]|nr:PDZ domain-containing protein [Dehalococcoidia bacterium]